MSRVEWCAELGSNHGGSKALAYELVRQAVLSGSNLVKFQLGWNSEAQGKYCDSYDERRNIDSWAGEIDKWCKDFGVEWFASIWSTEGLEVARSVGMKRYKIAHQLNDNKLIDAIHEVANGNVVHSSTIFDQMGGEFAFTTDEYPTYFPNLPQRLRRYSSHAHGIGDALIAVSRGAEYIEKHFALSNYAGFPKDAAFSLTPPEFADMVKYGNEIARLL